MWLLNVSARASFWLNQVALWFAKIELDMLARGILYVCGYRSKILRYISGRRQTSSFQPSVSRRRCESSPETGVFWGVLGSRLQARNCTIFGAAPTQPVYSGIPDTCISEFDGVTTTVSPALTPLTTEPNTAHAPAFNGENPMFTVAEIWRAMGVPPPIVSNPPDVRSPDAVRLPFTV